MGAAVTVKTNCGRSVSKDVRGGRFAFSTDGNSLGRKRERFLVAISLTSFHFVVVDRWKKTKRWHGIVEYPLSSEFDGFGREISCYGIIEFENFISLS